MARTAAKPAPPKAPALRTPAIVAIENLAKLASGGAPPARMVAAIDALLIEWGAEELSPADLRERVEQLQADIDAGVEAAQDDKAEADSPGALKAAEAQVAALTAVRDRLAKVIEG